MVCGPDVSLMPRHWPKNGWFFGRFDADGAVWCERCEEWFRAERLDEGTSGPDRTLSDNEGSDSGVTPSDGRETQIP